MAVLCRIIKLSKPAVLTIPDIILYSTDMGTSGKQFFLNLVRHSGHVRNQRAKPWKVENEVKSYDNPLILTNDFPNGWPMLNKIQN